jgi:putative membrane protein
MANPAPGAGNFNELAANERTMLAWVRTSVSLISFGFAIARLGQWMQSLGRRDPLGGTIILGAIFAFLGAAAQIIGVVRYTAVRRAILAGGHPPLEGLWIVSLAIAVAALGLLVGFYVFV